MAHDGFGESTSWSGYTPVFILLIWSPSIINMPSSSFYLSFIVHLLILFVINIQFLEAIAA
jgi:hypothetical protein